MNRRHFLALATALPVSGGLLWAKASAAAVTREALFVADRRLLKPLANVAAERTVTLGGDVARAWFTVIDPHLAATGQPLRGETLGDALFCLSVLAAGKGWRLGEVSESATGLVIADQNYKQETAYRWVLTPRDAGKFGRI